ncbi:MAG: lipoate--protein ligase family protein [Aigarchaeota archaeon]|nr:lipoate--protein ligase family protein [Aigarchaeota archaeon]
MERSWRLIETEFPDDPGLNLALDEALLLAANDEQKAETLRLWRNSNCVVLGRREDAALEVNLEEAAKHGAKIARRFTAGGTVYHDLGNLNWTLVFHRDTRVFARWSSMQEMFEALSEPLVEALTDTGADAKFQPPSSINVHGKKISGMAAYLKSDSILCHGTLLVTTNLMHLEALLRNPRFQVTTLQRELGEVDIREVAEAVKRSYEARVNRFNKTTPSAEELRLATHLIRTKYCTDGWNKLGSICRPIDIKP